MNAIRLVQINQESEPADPLLTLSEIAQQSCAATAALYKAAGFDPPWVGYLAVCDNRVVGTCAFNTIAYPAPGRNGKAEIAYFTFPEFEGQGFGTQMGSALIDIARAFSSEITLIAHTLPHTNASNSILQKLGFAFAGSIQHPDDGEVWKWELVGDDDGLR